MSEKKSDSPSLPAEERWNACAEEYLRDVIGFSSYLNEAFAEIDRQRRQREEEDAQSQSAKPE